MQKTFMQRPADVKREWHVVDAKGKILGDVAGEIARLLMGKQRPSFTPHVDAGDYVVVINATEFAVTGRKMTDKMYYRHSGIPGGFREENMATLLDRAPERIIEKAVKGMLPKNKLQTPRLRRMKIFAGAEHTYQDKLTK